MVRIKEIYVRFIGAMRDKRNNNDRILYFTDDLNSHITESMMTHHIYISDKKLKKVINNEYLKKKNDPLDYKELGMEIGDLSDDLIQLLNNKIVMFRLGQRVKVKVRDNKIIEFIDFYPKTGVFNPKLLYSISKKIYNTVVKSEYCSVNIKESIVIASYEAFNSLIRYPMTIEEDSKIYKFVEDNYCHLDKIEDLFVKLSSVGLDYVLRQRSDVHNMDKEKDIVLLQLRNNMEMLRVLYLQYKGLIQDEYPNELYKIFIPKIDGVKIDVSEKVIKKAIIKTHKRNVKMSNNKREEVLAILEEQNLEVEGISRIITKENFDTFSWENTTIVDGFDKNILNKKKIYIEEDYINKELEKQRKLEESNYIHNSLVRRMTHNIKHNKYIPAYSRFIDLMFEDLNKNIFVFEMKSIKNSKDENNEYGQLIKAYAQLEFYPFIHELSTSAFRSVVLSQKPKDERIINFLKSKNINIIWLENDIFNTMNWTDNNVKEFLKKQVVII